MVRVSRHGLGQLCCFNQTLTQVVSVNWERGGGETILVGTQTAVRCTKSKSFTTILTCSLRIAFGPPTDRFHEFMPVLYMLWLRFLWVRVAHFGTFKAFFLHIATDTVGGLTVGMRVDLDDTECKCCPLDKGFRGQSLWGCESYVFWCFYWRGEFSRGIEKSSAIGGGIRIRMKKKEASPRLDSGRSTQIRQTVFPSRFGKRATLRPGRSQSG